ncbi:MAG: NAD-dependent epimerase/dehydratase family protein [archaeon]
MNTPEPSDRTILVTGGAGFVGSHLAERLVPDNEVRVIDDLSTGKREHVPDDAELTVADVRDEDALAEAMADVDLVFHEAAVVSVEESVRHPTATHHVNVDGTLRVLEAARDEDARVIVASSAAIYGHPDGVPVAEDAPKAPTSPYGIDKLAVDHYTRRYHELYGLETVALRYFNIYGPRQGAGDYSGVIEAFFEQAEAGGPITVEGDGTQTRDFVHVEDVVDANLLAATTDHVGEAFNVGTGVETSILELAETIQAIVDADAEITHTDPREGDIDRSRADVTEARERLGFESVIALEAGLARLSETRF